MGCFIGSISVTGKTKWDVLDSLVKRTFKQYLSRIDQSTNLGLTSESIHAFIVGEVCRIKDGDVPELLPYGYLVGDTTNIKIKLKGNDIVCNCQLALTIFLHLFYFNCHNQICLHIQYGNCHIIQLQC